MLITCIFKPLEISLNFPPPSQSQYGDFQVDFFFAALPTPTASLITGDYLCQSAQNIQKAVEMIQEAQKITPYIQNGYGAFLDFFS